MIVLETDRLLLRRFTLDDSAFILRLLNEPSFIQNVGDKGVRTLEQASSYLNRAKILAIVSPTNAASIKVLQKLGFAFSKFVQMPPDNSEVALYELNFTHTKVER